MTKKQMGIIFTLLALIICTALLAGKLNNGGLNETPDISQVLSENDIVDTNKTKEESEVAKAENKDGTVSEEQTSVNAQDFFYQAINERDQIDAATTQELTAQLENANINEATKQEISNQLQKLTLRQDKQKSIELNLKNKGYEYAICTISEDDKKADITVKANNIDETESALIQEIVENASGIRNVTIQYIK